MLTRYEVTDTHTRRHTHTHTHTHTVNDKSLADTTPSSITMCDAGDPKGVMLTHANMLICLQSVYSHARVCQHHRTLTASATTVWSVYVVGASVCVWRGDVIRVCVCVCVLSLIHI